MTLHARINFLQSLEHTPRGTEYLSQQHNSYNIANTSSSSLCLCFSSSSSWHLLSPQRLASSPLCSAADAFCLLKGWSLSSLCSATDPSCLLKGWPLLCVQQLTPLVSSKAGLSLLQLSLRLHIDCALIAPTTGG